jgi:hypothetical protein
MGDFAFWASSDRRELPEMDTRIVADAESASRFRLLGSPADDKVFS